MKEMPVDGLSLERLTLLGRVHIARVGVDSFRLPDNHRADDSIITPPRTKVKGKPPRPSPKRNKNWYVTDIRKSF